MSTLYICEKPSQAKDIASELGLVSRGDGFIQCRPGVVTWCFGHLLEMSSPDQYDSRYKLWSFESLPIPPTHWALQVKPSATKQFNVIKRLLGQASHVIIATDADREGEMIAREILDKVGYSGSIERLWLSALDPASIRKALSTLRKDDETRPLYHAGLGRSRADWLIGMNLTRAYTALSRQSGGHDVVSIGRVQTPTLNLVVMRDQEIEQFVPKPYFELQIGCDAEGHTYRARWLPGQSPDVVIDEDKRCLDRFAAERVIREIQGQMGTIVHFDRAIKEEGHPLPFDLSSLQAEASRRFGLDASQTLEAAQSLYETHKAISYPRSDSRYLPLSQFTEASSIIKLLQRNDPDWAGRTDLTRVDTSIRSLCWNDTKVTAHHAIIPTQGQFDIDRLSTPEHQIYELVRLHYLMQFLPRYRYQAIECLTEIAGHTFHSRGRIDIDADWRVLLRKSHLENKTEEEAELQVLPDNLKTGLTIRCLDQQLIERETRPPARFTSGTLTTAMKNVGRTVENPELRKVLKETSGIGTVATRAAIIEVLLQRGYLAKSGKHLISTEFGRSLIAVLPDVLKDPATTALWEQVLDDIAGGRASLDDFLNKQGGFIRQMIEYLSGLTISLAASSRGGNKAKASTTRKKSTGRKPSSATNASGDHKWVEGQACPVCETGKLQLKTIKTGKNKGKHFLGCNHFPKCRAFTWHA
jgi:DNA topoisomerase-3